MKEKTVGEIVRERPVHFVVEDDSALDAARYMTEHQIGAVPVLAKGYEVGILSDQVGIFSERDLMTRVVAQGLNPASTTIGEVMTRKVVTLDGDSTCKDALAIMKQLHVRHLPVMIGKRIIGCVSIRELQGVDIEAKEAEIEFLDDYIEKVESVM